MMCILCQFLQYYYSNPKVFTGKLEGVSSEDDLVVQCGVLFLLRMGQTLNVALLETMHCVVKCILNVSLVGIADLL